MAGGSWKRGDGYHSRGGYWFVLWVGVSQSATQHTVERLRTSLLDMHYSAVHSERGRALFLTPSIVARSQRGGPKARFTLILNHTVNRGLLCSAFFFLFASLGVLVAWCF